MIMFRFYFAGVALVAVVACSNAHLQNIDAPAKLTPVHGLFEKWYHVWYYRHSEVNSYNEAPEHVVPLKEIPFTELIASDETFTLQTHASAYHSLEKHVKEVVAPKLDGKRWSVVYSNALNPQMTFQRH